MKTLIALSFSAALLAPPSAPQQSVAGLWDAAVTVKQAYATFCSRRHLKESRNRTNEERI